MVPSVIATSPHSVRCLTRSGRVADGQRFRYAPIILPVPMEAFLVSTGVVALGEIGDKTQLLALCSPRAFASRWPIIAGILVATLANHALAGFVGNLVRAVVPRRRADVARRACRSSPSPSWALQARQARRRAAPPRNPLGYLRRYRRRVLPGRDGRQDAGRDGRARRASSTRSPPWSSARPLGMLIANVPVVLVGKCRRRRFRSRPSASPPRCSSRRSASTCSYAGDAARRETGVGSGAGIIARSRPRRRLAMTGSAALPCPMKPFNPAEIEAAAQPRGAPPTPIAPDETPRQARSTTACRCCPTRPASCTWGTCATTRSTT